MLILIITLYRLIFTSAEINLRYAVQKDGILQENLLVQVTGIVTYNRLHFGDASFSGEVKIGTTSIIVEKTHAISLFYPTKDFSTWGFFLFGSQEMRGGRIASEIIGDDFVIGAIDPLSGNIYLSYTQNYQSYVINLLLTESAGEQTCAFS